MRASLDGSHGHRVAGPPPLAHVVKQRTAAVHHRVEHGLDLLSADVDVARLREVVGRLLGFVAPGEAALADWARREPAVAAALDWPRRRRTPHLRIDLSRLGGDAAGIAQAPSRVVAPDTADALGWLYVFEGSTLGGAIIERRLRERGCAVDLRSFAPYEEGPGPMWRVYLRVAGAWTDGDDARTAAVASAAEEVFGALADWLAPVFVGGTVLA